MENLGNIGLRSTSISVVDIQVSFGRLLGSCLSGNEQLTSINLSNVLSIDPGAFGGCNNLSILVLPKTKIINESIFRLKGTGEKISSLTELSISEGTTTLGENCLSGFSQLVNVQFPNSVSSLGNNAFTGCDQIQDLKFGKNLQYNESTFNGLNNLYTLDIPYLSTISSNGITSLTSLNTLSLQHNNTLFSFNTQFSNLSATNLYFENDGQYISSLDVSSFLKMPNIETINLQHSSISTISTGTFVDCSQLQTLNLPLTLSTIQYESFTGCLNLTFYNNMPSGLTSLYENDVRITISSFFPNLKILGSKGGSKVNVVNDENVLNIPNDVYLETSAFYGNTSLQNVRFANGISNDMFPDGIFENCTQLLSVELQPALSEKKITIGDNAFKSTTSLKQFNFDNVSSIGRYSFSDSKLTSDLNLSSVSCIGDYAFQRCYTTTVYLSENLFNDSSNIGTSVFNKCNNIYLIDATKITQDQLTSVIPGTKITDPGNKQSIIKAYEKIKSRFGVQSDFTFKVSDMTYSHTGEMNYQCLQYASDNTTLLSVIEKWDLDAFIRNRYKLPDYTKTISSNAFDYIKIEKINTLSCIFGENVLSIADEVFSNSKLISVYFPSLGQIGKKQFSNNFNLSNVILNGASYIGESAFYNCSSLMTACIYPNTLSIFNDAFYNCNSISNVVIFNNVNYIGNEAFKGCTHISQFSFNDLDNSKLNVINENFISGTSILSLMLPRSISELKKGSLNGLPEILSVSFYSKYKDDISGIILKLDNEVSAKAGTKFFTKDNNYLYPTFITKE